MKRIIFIFVLLVSVLSVYGGISYEDSNYKSYCIDEPFVLKIFVSNHSDFITDAECKITMYDPSGNPDIDNEDMILLGSRFYLYPINIIDEVGEWLAIYTCNNSDDSQVTEMREFVVIKPADTTTINKNLTTITNNTVQIISDVSNVNDTTNQINDTLNDVEVIVNDINDTSNNIFTQTTEINNTLDYVNKSTISTFTAVRTLSVNLRNSRFFEYIWELFSPRTITNGGGTEINRTTIATCVWNDPYSSECDKYREIDNIR